MEAPERLGDYGRRLKALADAEAARRAENVRDAEHHRQFEAAVGAYIEARLPDAEMDDAERRSLSATLEDIARRLLREDSPDFQQWGALGFSLAEFRNERRRRMRRWLLADVLYRRLSYLEERDLGIGPWRDYVTILEEQVVGPQLDTHLQADVRSLRQIADDALHAETCNKGLRARAAGRSMPGADRTGIYRKGATPISLEEWLCPGSQSSQERGVATGQAVQVAPARPYRMQGLNVPDTRRRLREVLDLNAQGLRSKDIGDRYNVPDTTVRTWLKNAREHEARGLLP